MCNIILFGVLMIFLVNLCFGIMSVFVKIIVDYFFFMENVFYCFIIMIFLFLFIYFFKFYCLKSYK